MDMSMAPASAPYPILFVRRFFLFIAQANEEALKSLVSLAELLHLRVISECPGRFSPADPMGGPCTMR
eukprot:4674640-Pleurochrysis_carterae.AAC.1